MDSVGAHVGLRLLKLEFRWTAVGSRAVARFGDRRADHPERSGLN